MDKNEELYLSCYQTLLMYYFKERLQTDIPIDYMYCNALETTSRIYKGSFIEKKSRFDYVNQLTLVDLKYLNINLLVTKCSNYNELKSILLQLLNNGEEVFIYVDEYYLPYSLQYNTLHTQHSHMIIGYDYMENESIIFHTVDNVGATIKQQKCSEEDLERAFNSINNNFVIHFEFNHYTNIRLDKQYFINRIRNLVLDYKDNYEIYNNFIIATEEEWENIRKHTEDLSFYSHSFGLISGSRYCFLKGLKSIGIHNPLIESYLTQYYQDAQVLMFLFGKAVFSTKLNMVNVKTKCKELLELDKKLICELKRCICNRNLNNA